jgi:raffinose/stachyose/melibiose transport system substrate-binding protein
MKSSRLALLALVALLVLAVAAACGGTPGEDTDDADSAAAPPAQSTNAATSAPAESSAADTGATPPDQATSDTAATDEGTESAPESTEEPASSEAAPAGIDVAAAGDVTLVFASSENDEGPKASLQALVKAFQEQYPNVKIEESYTAFDPYMKRVKLLASDDNAPDVFAGNQGYGVDGELVKAGLIAPLDEYADGLGWTEAFGEGTLQQFRWTEGGKQFGEGNIYGVGSAGEAVGLFYNQAKLTELGFDGPPETLAELDEMLAAAKEHGWTPINYGNQDAWPGLHIWGSVQGQFVDAQTVRDVILSKPGGTYDTPENLQAAQKIAEWVAAGYFNKDINGKPNETGNAEFVKGEGVFNITGTWQTAAFSENPDIHFANLPVGASGKRVQTGSLSVPYHVSSKSEHPEVAAAFIDFITNAPSVETMIANGRVPAVPTDLTADTQLNTEAIEAWKTLSEDEGLAFYPDWSTNTMYDTMSSAMQGLLAGDVSPEDYIKRLEDDYSKFQSSRES